MRRNLRLDLLLPKRASVTTVQTVDFKTERLIRSTASVKVAHASHALAPAFGAISTG